MTEQNSADHYRGRERQERTLAGRAFSPAIATIQREMAERHAMLAKDVATFAVAPRHPARTA